MPFLYLVVFLCCCLLPGCDDAADHLPEPPLVIFTPDPAPLRCLTPQQLREEINICEDLIPKGEFGRCKPRELVPHYITIHATRNMNASANAARHASVLKMGRITGGAVGYLSWHFTVDCGEVRQHLPLNEMGHHAEYGYKPGNLYSIGIEMCENEGNDMPATFERTAKLAALLMLEYRIPLKCVVGHIFWTGKKCPAPLLDDGCLGATWAGFISRVDYYDRCLKFGLQQQQKRAENKAG